MQNLVENPVEMGARPCLLCVNDQGLGVALLLQLVPIKEAHG
jgi:hypothetical protein